MKLKPILNLTSCLILLKQAEWTCWRSFKACWLWLWLCCWCWNIDEKLALGMICCTGDQKLVGLLIFGASSFSKFPIENFRLFAEKRVEFEALSTVSTSIWNKNFKSLKIKEQTHVFYINVFLTNSPHLQSRSCQKHLKRLSRRMNPARAWYHVLEAGVEIAEAVRRPPSSEAMEAILPVEPPNWGKDWRSTCWASNDLVPSFSSLISVRSLLSEKTKFY